MQRFSRLLKAVNKKPKPIKLARKVTVPILVPYEKPEPISLEERFNSKFRISESGCWEWQGRLDRYGYGVFKIGRITLKAHRFSYEYYIGPFIKSLHVLHKCDNPKCVNPDHLFLGTNQDNIKDKVDKGRSKFYYKQLTNDEKKNILSLLEKHLPKKQIAESFNVHISTVSRLQQKQNRV